MSDLELLAKGFEAHRAHLRAVRLPDAWLVQRSRARSAGVMAPAQPFRRRRDHEPWRLADYGGGARLPGCCVHAGHAAKMRSRGNQREIVDAFLAASREGNFEALLTLLDPDVVLRADGAAAGMDGMGAEAEVIGAQAVARIELLADPSVLATFRIEYLGTGGQQG